MLDGACHNVSNIGIGFEHATNRHIIRFTAGTRKNDFSRFRTNQCCGLSSRGTNRITRLCAFTVKTGRVSKMVGQIRFHCVDNCRDKACRRIRIKIYGG